MGENKIIPRRSPALGVEGEHSAQTKKRFLGNTHAGRQPSSKSLGVRGGRLTKFQDRDGVAKQGQLLWSTASAETYEGFGHHFQPTGNRKKEQSERTQSNRDPEISLN